jgi:hypothetical protein
MSSQGKKGSKLPTDWTSAHDTFINACHLTGTSLAWARENCILLSTNEPVIKAENWKWVRTTRASNQKRSLGKSKRRKGKADDPRNDYVVVPLGYDFAKVVRVPEGAVLPKFTSQHYLSQFSSPSSSTTTSIKQSTMSTSSKKSPVKTKRPTKNVVTGDISDALSALTVHAHEDGLLVVNPEDDSWDEVVQVVVGKENPLDVIAAVLNNHKFGEGKKEWMSALMLILPLQGRALNGKMLKPTAQLVKVTDGRRAVFFKLPIEEESQENRMAKDVTVPIVAVLNNIYG